MSAEKHSGRPVEGGEGGAVGVTAEQVGNRILSPFGFHSHLVNQEVGRTLRGEGKAVRASKATLM